MKDQKINFAIVGCGRIGQRFAALVKAHPLARLSALCEHEPKLHSAVKPFAVPVYQSMSKMMSEQPDVDVIYIATPNALHSVQAVKALVAGFHVVVEKPLALTKSEAEKIIFTALQKTRHVFGVMQNRYSPPAACLQQMLDSGHLGQINMVQINC